jgi:hypothetical protein
MKRWQKLEDATVAKTSEIATQTDNPLIRQVMQIILHDSSRHRRVQQMIIDSVEREGIVVSPEDLAEVWGSIEAHLEMERKTIELGKESLEALEGGRNVIQLYLLSYLLADEEKHERLLTDLELIKKGMYP